MIHYQGENVGLRDVSRVFQKNGRTWNVAVPGIAGLADGRGVAVGARQEGHEGAQLEQGLDVVVEGAVGHARDGRVRPRPAQLLERHVLVGHRLDHVGPRDEQVRRVLHRWPDTREEIVKESLVCKDKGRSP